MTEYLVVSDTNSKIILSTMEWKEAVRCASMIRKAAGTVTIFKATKY